MSKNKKPRNYSKSSKSAVRKPDYLLNQRLEEGRKRIDQVDVELKRRGLPLNGTYHAEYKDNKLTALRYEGKSLDLNQSSDYGTPNNVNDDRASLSSNTADRLFTKEELEALGRARDSTPIDAPESYKVTPIAMGSPFDNQEAAQRRAEEIIAEGDSPASVESRTDPGLNTEQVQEANKSSNSESDSGFIGPEPHGFSEQNYQVFYHDVRIWIQGADVSDWLEGSLSIKYNLNTDPNTVDFTLNNAGNRFVLTPENLSGIWRDADSDYSEIAKHKIFNIKTNPFLNQPDKESGGLIWPLNHWGLIFHKMDPIRVWIRNPAARMENGILKNEWLPLFTGYVTSFPKTDNYINAASSIQIHAEDIRTIIKNMRVNANTILYPTAQGAEVVNPTTAEGVNSRLEFHPNANKQFDATFFKDLLVKANTGNPWVDLTLPEIIEALTFSEDAQVMINTAHNRRAKELAGTIEKLDAEIKEEKNASEKVRKQAVLSNLKKEQSSNYPSETTQVPDSRDIKPNSRMGRMHRGWFRGATKSPVYPSADNKNLQVQFLQEWYNLCIFGSRQRNPKTGNLDFNFEDIKYWTSTDIELVGALTFTTAPWAPDNQAVHMIEPGLATTALPIFQDVAVISGENVVSGTREYTNRLELLNQACDIVDYRFWVTGTGDIIFEFPQYDFSPSDYGPWSNILSFDHHVLDERLDEEATDVPTVLLASGSITARLDTKGADQTYAAEMDHVIVWCPALAARLGVNQQAVTFNRIIDRERLLQLAYMAMQKRMAVFTQYSMGTCYRPWVLPNKPVFNKYRSKYALVESVTHTIPVTAGSLAGHTPPGTSLALNYVRSIDIYGVPRYITGGPSMPIFYGEKRANTLVSSLSQAATSIKTFLEQVENKTQLLTSDSLNELFDAYGSFLPVGQDIYNVLAVLSAESPVRTRGVPNTVEELNSAAITVRETLAALSSEVDSRLSTGVRKKAIKATQAALDKLIELFKDINIEYKPTESAQYGLLPVSGITGFRHDDAQSATTSNATTADPETFCDLDRFFYSSPLGSATSNLTYGNKVLQISEVQPFPRISITSFDQTPSNVSSKLSEFQGLDFLAKVGENVYACADGRVSEVLTTDKYGTVIRIEHDAKYFTQYSPVYTLLKKDENVLRNQIIGTVAPMTARAKFFDAPSPVLHFQTAASVNNVPHFYDPANSGTGLNPGVPNRIYTVSNLLSRGVEKDSWKNNKVLLVGSLVSGAFGRKLSSQLESLKAQVILYSQPGGTPGGKGSLSLTNPDNLAKFQKLMLDVKPDVTFVMYGAYEADALDIKIAMSDISTVIKNIAKSKLWWIGPPSYGGFNPTALAKSQSTFDSEGIIVLGNSYVSSVDLTPPLLTEEVTPAGAVTWVEGVLQRTTGSTNNKTVAETSDSITGGDWSAAKPPESCPPSKQRQRVPVVTTLSPVSPVGIRASVSNIQQLIILTAKKQPTANTAIAKILPGVALAFCEIESHFNPNSVPHKTDLWYKKKGGSLYRKLVQNSTKFSNNPYKDKQELWVSYGLFHLLAVYHISGQEDPRILFDPEINATRAIAKIAEDLAIYNNDPEAVRLVYVGYNPNTTRSDAEKVREKFRRIYSKYANQFY
jgi:murein DD-endopeptidase MepM/ murein hydrolase activator NlpD